MFFGRNWQVLASIAGLLAVQPHPGDISACAVAEAGPGGAVRVAVIARVTAQLAGLLAIGAHPGDMEAGAVAAAGPNVARGIVAVGILAIAI